jgi:hypothetical protein
MLRGRTAFGLVIVALVALVGHAGPARACLACIAMPAESLGDKAMAAEVVALLRPDPADPFRFVPITFLKGDGADLPPVPFLVNRNHAAALGADADAAVMATYSASHGWAIHDIGGAALGQTIAGLLSRDLSTAEARRDAFGPLLSAEDTAIKRMAMIELATLPYPVLRQTTARLDRTEVARMANDPTWMEWAPVAIILLGLSEAADDRAFIRRAANIAARSGHTLHLAAWLTALIEGDGPAAIDWIATTYIDRPDRNDGELRQVGLALASHAARDDTTGAAIREAMGRLAAARPPVAAALAQTMTDRQDWSLAPEAARWLDEGRVTSPADAFLLTSYVLAAEAAQTEIVQ